LTVCLVGETRPPEGAHAARPQELGNVSLSLH
jgi:hypothetical protein